MPILWIPKRFDLLFKMSAVKGGWHIMARPFSIDLRERVVSAVVRGGVSCRGAMSSSWTISAPTRARPFGAPEPGCSSCQSIPPTRIPPLGERPAFTCRSVIEQFFSKLKHWLRKAERRDAGGISEAINHILNTVTPQECANYIKNAGYEYT